MKYTIPIFLTIVFAVSAANADVAPDAPFDLDAVRLPDGFSISVYADDLPGARSMALSPDGVLFVGTRTVGTVYAVRDTNGDNRADESFVIDTGLTMPNGVAFRNGSLYLAEIFRVVRYDDIENRLADPPEPVVVRDDFPTDRHHGWKFIAFGPDGKLYVPVGAPCNVCERDDERYSSIMRMNPDGTELEVYAAGVRNSVGFDWRPGTNELWFTDNGRDLLGDDLPPDELNRAPEAGMHFGFPYCHGGDIIDPDFGSGHSCDDFTPPAMKLGPHVAALGMRFYTGDMFPPEYRNRIFIAEHGSWNRTNPLGYRVMTVTVENGRAVDYDVFAEGWLTEGGAAWGRPVDVLVMPDGALLVSDGRAGVIYRIAHEAVNVEDEEPRAFRLNAPHPNPFNATVSMNYELGENSPVRLTVFDASGAVTATVAGGYRNAGLHSFTWDGRDVSGAEAGSGLYFMQVAAGEDTAVKKVMLLR